MPFLEKLATDKRISNSEGAAVSAQQSHFFAGNSRGFRGGYASSRHSISVAPIAGRGAGMQRDSWYSSMRDAADLADVERDFPSFRVERSFKRFMHAPPLPVHKLPGGSLMGWHLWVYLTPRPLSRASRLDQSEIVQRSA